MGVGSSDLSGPATSPENHSTILESQKLPMQNQNLHGSCMAQKKVHNRFGNCISGSNPLTSAGQYRLDGAFPARQKAFNTSVA